MTEIKPDSTGRSKLVLIIGHVFFLSLIVLSGIYYKERMLFLDSAYHIFEFITRGQFQIFNQRFICVLTQFIPLIGIQQGWPLSSVVISYSLSFTVLFYIYFIITAHSIKNKEVAMLFIVFIGLFVRHIFFWTYSELIQGIMLLFVVYALFKKEKVTMKRGILLFLLSIPVAYSHHLIVFPFVFLILYEMFRTREFKSYYYWAVLLIVLGLYFFRLDVPLDAPEHERISFTNPFIHIGEMFGVQSNAIFLKWLVFDYPLLLLGLIAVIVYYANKKDYALMWLVIISFVGYSQIINLSFMKINPEFQFTFENLYLPLSVFVAVPLVFDVFADIRFSRYSGYALAAIVVIRIFMITSVSGQYSQRVSYLQNMIDDTKKFDERKFVISESDLNMKILKYDWALIFGTILLSSLENKNDSRIIYATTDDINTFELDRGPWVYHPFRSFRTDELDPRYFNLPITPYRRLYQSDIE